MPTPKRCCWKNSSASRKTIEMADTPKGQAELPPVKQAILELRAMRSKLEELEYRQSEPIAIIGAGLRFPGGANDLTSFWQLLLGG